MQQGMKTLANPFSYYRSLIDGILDIPDVSVLPICDVATETNMERPIVALRHDIDADVWTAIKAARYLARHGLCGSFYLLPTAGYYGHFENQAFFRDARMEHHMDALIQAGCEIGLHNDAFSYCRNHGVDGVDALCAELQWLRERGAVIRGTAAHNSFPVFGAENFEVFEEWMLWPRSRGEKGHNLPIGALSANALALDYEANLPKRRSDMDAAAVQTYLDSDTWMDVRDTEWMRTYLANNPTFETGWNAHGYLVGRDWWMIADRCGQPSEFRSWMTQVDVLDFLTRLAPGQRCVLTVHPCYVGDDESHP